ncbi:choice-of-anchor P family protein [Jatrophihabitans sp. YIM 134969]
MPHTRAAAAVTTLLTAAAVTVATAAPATAAPTTKSPLFGATAAGIAATLLGGLANSGPTAPVAITTRSTSKSGSTTAASATIPGLLNAGEVRTDVSTARNAKNTATIVTGHARTAGVNILGGTLTLSAIDTRSSLTVKPDKVAGTAQSTFTNLKITGQAVINGTVAPNTTIEVPGVARIVLNASGVAGGIHEGMAVSTGILVTVLSGSAVGSTIAINPTTAQTQYVSPLYAPLNGLAFSAAVTAESDASASIGPLGAIGMPTTGTKGTDISANVASSNLAGLGTLGTATSTANGTATNKGSRSTMVNTIAGLNLLGGLITADNVTTRAEVTLSGAGVYTPTSTVDFVNLRIANTPIALNVAPNTTVALPGVGGVVIRGTATTANAAAGAALTIALTTAAFGLPAGATITIGFAYASVMPNDL